MSSSSLTAERTPQDFLDLAAEFVLTRVEKQADSAALVSAVNAKTTTLLRGVRPDMPNGVRDFGYDIHDRAGGDAMSLDSGKDGVLEPTIIHHLFSDAGGHIKIEPLANSKELNESGRDNASPWYLWTTLVREESAAEDLDQFRTFTEADVLRPAMAFSERKRLKQPSEDDSSAVGRYDPKAAETTLDEPKESVGDQLWYFGGSLNIMEAAGSLNDNVRVSMGTYSCSDPMSKLFFATSEEGAKRLKTAITELTDLLQRGGSIGDSTRSIEQN